MKKKNQPIWASTKKNPFSDPFLVSKGPFEDPLGGPLFNTFRSWKRYNYLCFATWAVSGSRGVLSRYVTILWFFKVQFSWDHEVNKL